jgi:hypothetical protein
VKKWILLVVLLVLAGVGIYVYVTIQAAGDDAAEYEMETMTADGVADGLKSPDLQKRLDAVAQLDKLSVEQKKAAFLDALGSAHAAARLTALTELRKGLAKDPEVVTAVLDLAKGDPDPDVADAAFSLLSVSGDPRILSVAAELLLSTDAPLAVKLKAAKTLDRLTGRETATDFSTAFDTAEEAADDLGMDWDDWITENAATLKWNPDAGRFE